MRKYTGLLLAAVLGIVGCDNRSNTSQNVQTENEVQTAVQPSSTVQKQDGIAFAVVVDNSGSMGDSVKDGRKIDLAQKAVRAVVAQAEKFSKEKPTPIRLTIYTFSDAPRNVLPLTQPSVAGANAAINGMSPGGGTAIGDAIIRATKELNSTGYTGVHVLVVTDGDNTNGISPDSVAGAFAKLPPQYRPNVYVVAFDTDDAKFKPLKDNGWKVLSAANGAELSNTLDEVVGGEILLEK